ncbi:hypothetical protein AB2N04_10820 [Nitratireductor sp. GISD-1A_MAKvit]|uniref:hypothetical protein n=1 Tax=Nitratireductor sp. GISD-1A_MAKvit TaxID=3234198 RepID=UPI0034658746
MKFRPHGGFFRATGLFVCCGALALSLSGCVSASLEDAAPAAAIVAPVEAELPASAATPESVPVTGVRRTGLYPDLNVPPESAAAPIDANEKDALTRDLSATRERLAGRAPANHAETEAARLRRLARTHAARQLEEIENTE